MGQEGYLKRGGAHGAQPQPQTRRGRRSADGQGCSAVRRWGGAKGRRQDARSCFVDSHTIVHHPSVSIFMFNIDI